MSCLKQRHTIGNSDEGTVDAPCSQYLILFANNSHTALHHLLAPHRFSPPRGKQSRIDRGWYCNLSHGSGNLLCACLMKRGRSDEGGKKRGGRAERRTHPFERRGLCYSIKPGPVPSIAVAFKKCLDNLHSQQFAFYDVC